MSGYHLSIWMLITSIKSLSNDEAEIIGLLYTTNLWLPSSQQEKKNVHFDLKKRRCRQLTLTGTMKQIEELFTAAYTNSRECNYDNIRMIFTELREKPGSIHTLDNLNQPEGTSILLNLWICIDEEKESVEQYLRSKESSVKFRLKSGWSLLDNKINNTDSNLWVNLARHYVIDIENMKAKVKLRIIDFKRQIENMSLKNKQDYYNNLKVQEVEYEKKYRACKIEICKYFIPIVFKSHSKNFEIDLFSKFVKAHVDLQVAREQKAILDRILIDNKTQVSPEKLASDEVKTEKQAWEGTKSDFADFVNDEYDKYKMKPKEYVKEHGYGFLSLRDATFKLYDQYIFSFEWNPINCYDLVRKH